MQMLIWQFIHKEILEHGLTTRDALASWVRGRIGRYHPALEIQIEERDWQEWDTNRLALGWLAKHREKPAGKRERGDGIPPFVSIAVDDVLGKTLNQLPSDWLSECNGIHVGLTNRSGEGASGNPSRGQYEDLAELWQAVFLSYFQPSLLESPSVCEKCGKNLGMTKAGKPSKQKLCKPCNTMKWKSENRERARKYDREQKREMRKRLN